MTKRIILEYPGGSIGIRGNLSPSFLRQHGGDVDAALRDIMANYIPVQDPGIPATVVDIDIPEWDYLRYSWIFVGGHISYDMSKARGIQMDKIREVRNKELTNLDVPFMRAIELGDVTEQQSIGERKQILRDIPQTFDLTTENNSPEELKQKWPDGLSKE